MTQEEKQLLVIDIYGRIPYGVKIATSSYRYGDVSTPKGIVGERCYFNDNPRYDGDCPVEEVKPYLRPMSSMTSDEKMEWFQMRQKHCNMSGFNELQERADFTSESSDWLNKKGFDFRGLIPMGLALEAPEGMYKTE